MLQALGLPEGEAVVTYATVSVSYVAQDAAEATTAIQAVHRWHQDYNRLAAAKTPPTGWRGRQSR